MSESTEDKARELLRLAGEATGGRWYVLGPPWGDGGFVVAGSDDPHQGTYVCNTDDELMLDEHDERKSANTVADATYIAAANPETITEILSDYLRMKEEAAEEEASDRKSALRRAATVFLHRTRPRALLRRRGVDRREDWGEAMNAEDRTHAQKLTPEIRKQLFRIASGSRMRQNHYLPAWKPNQTYGGLQPGHQLNMAAIQRHLADLIVLTDWMPAALSALQAAERRERVLRETLGEIQIAANTLLYLLDEPHSAKSLLAARQKLNQALVDAANGTAQSALAREALDSPVDEA